MSAQLILQDRRIACDRAVPTCGCCLKAGRVCTGYGLRLSWPKENDKRRSIVVRTPYSLPQKIDLLDMHMVNIGKWEMEVYNYLTTTDPMGLYTYMVTKT